MSVMPTLVFCPYLRLHTSYEFADFRIGPLDSFQGEWSPPSLEHAAKTLLSRFVTVDGRQVQRPSILSTAENAVDGTMPGHPDALRLAVTFGALVTNPRHPIDEYDSWKVITADNCDLWIQPIDLMQSRITLPRGSRVSTLASGHRFDDDSFRVQPPLELHWHGAASFDADVAAATYRIASAPDSTEDPILARRLVQAIRWWNKAWFNSASISWEDRVVQLRTAVDALVGSDKTKTAIAWLTDLFSGLDSDSRGDLLWIDDDASYPRTWGSPPRTELVSAFEHWFWSFATARNETVHTGAAGSLQYAESISPYNGHLVDVADRVVAEAILAALHRCGFQHLWRTSAWRSAVQHLRELQSGEKTDPDGASVS